MKRVQKIVDFLISNGIVANQIQPDAVGDSSSASRLKDNELDRSVAFVILQKGHFDPRPPRKTPAAPEVTTQFRLRLSAEITITGVPRIRPPRGKLGGGPATDALLFEIQDVEHKISAFYGYSGLGMGVGVNLAWLSRTDLVRGTTSPPPPR